MKEIKEKTFTEEVEDSQYNSEQEELQKLKGFNPFGRL